MVDHGLQLFKVYQYIVIATFDRGIISNVIHVFVSSDLLKCVTYNKYKQSKSSIL